MLEMRRGNDDRIDLARANERLAAVVSLQPFSLVLGELIGKSIGHRHQFAPRHLAVGEIAHVNLPDVAQPDDANAYVVHDEIR